MDSEEPSRKLSFPKMFFLGFIVSLPCVLGGFAEGYATLALPQMKLSVEEASWFSSVPGFGALVGALLISILVDAVGRRNSILVAIVTHILGWSLLAWNLNFTVVLVGRVLTGLTLGSIFYPGQVYAVECLAVYNKRMRSSLATWSGTTHSVGVFLVIFLSYIFDFRYMSTFAAGFALVMFIMIASMLPESPTWLYLQGRKGDAELSLKKLGLCQSFFNDVEPVTTIFPDQPQKFSWLSWLFNLQKLRRKDVYKPTLILTLANVILTFSGAHAVLNYQVITIGPNPNSTGTDVQQDFSFAYKSSVVSGVLILVAHACTTLILPIIGVRKVSIPSCICLGATLIFLGYTTQEKENPNLFIWKVVAVWLITFIYHFGVQTLPMAVLGDSFPADAKGFAGIPILGLVFAASVLVKIHLFLLTGLGANIYYIYAGISFMGAFYLIAFFYETVGKSLQEIHERYRR